MTNKNVKYLSAKDVLEAQDRKFKDIEVPEWEGMVRISTITGKARDRFEASILNKVGGGMNTDNIRAKLVAMCLVDQDGKPLFTESDIAKLGEKSCTALDRIFNEAQRLNGIGSQEVEQIAKN